MGRHCRITEDVKQMAAFTQPFACIGRHMKPKERFDRLFAVLGDRQEERRDGR